MGIHKPKEELIFWFEHLDAKGRGKVAELRGRLDAAGLLAAPLVSDPPLGISTHRPSGPAPEGPAGEGVAAPHRGPAGPAAGPPATERTAGQGGGGGGGRTPSPPPLPRDGRR